MLCDGYLMKLNEQKVDIDVNKEIYAAMVNKVKILENESDVKGKELLQLKQDLASTRCDLEEKIMESNGLKEKV